MKGCAAFFVSIARISQSFENEEVDIMKENTSILPARFNRDKDEWNLIDNSGTNIKADILTFVTYNTWFDDFHFEERFRAITEILRESNADIIALQEITNASLEISCKKTG